MCNQKRKHPWGQQNLVLHCGILHANKKMS